MKKTTAAGTSYVEYSSNNSGGQWWLKDADWKALEDAGWEVEWGGAYFCGAVDGRKPRYKFAKCKTASACPGHRVARSYAEAMEIGDAIRWLGCLAKRAIKPNCDDIRAAADEFERVTGNSATDAGCPCCGQPHTFSLYVNGNWVESGPSVSYEARW